MDSIKDIVRSSMKLPEFQPKCCGNNNEDEDNSQQTLNDKNHQALSQKFRQLISFCIITFTFGLMPLEKGMMNPLIPTAMS